jgi:hypothetical protein
MSKTFAVVAIALLAGFAQAFTLSSRPYATSSYQRLHQGSASGVRCVSGGIDSENSGSVGVEEAIRYLNSPSAKVLLNKMALSNPALEDEAQRMNFWTGGNFVVDSSTCTGIVAEGLQVRANCKVKDKDQTRDVLVPFPSKVDNEVMLKNVLVRVTQ